MPHRRPIRKGSFGSHLDELVTRFPASEERASAPRSGASGPAELQEKIDIHALLFERAWALNEER